MSNVIRFLETMGRDARVADLDPSAFAQLVEGLEGDRESKLALIGRDASVLSRLMEGRHKMFCFIMAPDDNEQQDAPEPDEQHDNPGESPGAREE